MSASFRISTIIIIIFFCYMRALDFSQSHETVHTGIREGINSRRDFTVRHGVRLIGEYMRYEGVVPDLITCWDLCAANRTAGPSRDGQMVTCSGISFIPAGVRDAMSTAPTTTKPTTTDTAVVGLTSTTIFTPHIIPTTQVNPSTTAPTSVAGRETIKGGFQVQQVRAKREQENNISSVKPKCYLYSSKTINGEEKGIHFTSILRGAEKEPEKADGKRLFGHYKEIYQDNRIKCRDVCVNDRPRCVAATFYLAGPGTHNQNCYLFESSTIAGRSSGNLNYTTYELLPPPPIVVTRFDEISTESSLPQFGGPAGANGATNLLLVSTSTSRLAVSGNDSTDGNSQLIILIGAISGGVFIFLLLVLFTITCFLKKRVQTPPTHYPTTRSMNDMRDSGDRRGTSFANRVIQLFSPFDRSLLQRAVPRVGELPNLPTNFATFRSQAPVAQQKPPSYISSYHGNGYELSGPPDSTTSYGSYLSPLASPYAVSSIPLHDSAQQGNGYLAMHPGDTISRDNDKIPQLTNL